MVGLLAAALALGDVPLPPGEQALRTSTSAAAPRASVRYLRIGSSLLNGTPAALPARPFWSLAANSEHHQYRVGGVAHQVRRRRSAAAGTVRRRRLARPGQARRRAAGAMRRRAR